MLLGCSRGFVPPWRLDIFFLHPWRLLIITSVDVVDDFDGMLLVGEGVQRSDIAMNQSSVMSSDVVRVAALRGVSDGMSQ